MAGFEWGISRSEHKDALPTLPSRRAVQIYFSYFFYQSSVLPTRKDDCQVVKQAKVHCFASKGQEMMSRKVARLFPELYDLTTMSNVVNWDE